MESMLIRGSDTYIIHVTDPQIGISISSFSKKRSKFGNGHLPIVRLEATKIESRILNPFEIVPINHIIPNLGNAPYVVTVFCS